MQRVVNILLLCYGLSVVRADVTQVCKNKKFGDSVPDPRDCSSYYFCGRQPTIKHCQAGLHFDARVKVCNWPNLADCRVNIEAEALTDTIVQREAEEAGAPMDFELKAEMQREMEELDQLEDQKDLAAAYEAEPLAEYGVAKENQFKPVAPEMANLFEPAALSEIEVALEMEAIQETLKELAEIYKNREPGTGEFKPVAQDTPILAIKQAAALPVIDTLKKTKQPPKNQLELEKEFQAGVKDLIIPPQIELIRGMSLLREPQAPEIAEIELIREALRKTKIQADVDKAAAVIKESTAPALVPVREVGEAAPPLDLMQLLAVEIMHTDVVQNIANIEDQEQLVAVKEAITRPRLTFTAIDVDTHTVIDPLTYYDPEQVECHHYGAYFLPHPRDCRKYYLCAFGHMLQHQCGRGTGWNYQLQECEVRQVADCYATLPDDDEFEMVAESAQQSEDVKPFVLPPLTPDPYTTTLPYGDGAMVCFLYADGTTGAPTWSYTSSTGSWAPTGSYHTATKDDNWAPTDSLYTDPQFIPHPTPPAITLSTGRTDSGDNAILMCPMTGQAYLAHTKDCSKYYICIVGMPVLTSCPDGLYWDQKAEFCDLAKNVNCPQLEN